MNSINFELIYPALLILAFYNIIIATIIGMFASGEDKNDRIQSVLLTSIAASLLAIALKMVAQ